MANRTVPGVYAQVDPTLWFGFSSISDCWISVSLINFHSMFELLCERNSEILRDFLTRGFD